MKLAIAADHRGYILKEELKKVITLIDYGTSSSEPYDYPLLVPPVCQDILTNKIDRAILLCGTGIGMSIAANRYQNIYAALVFNSDMARRAREDEDANILILPADYITLKGALECVDAWLNAQFHGGRHQRRIDYINKLPIY